MLLGAAVVLLAGCGTTTSGQPTASSGSPSAPASMKAADLSGFTPSEADRDPSTKIPDIEIKPYKSGQHIQAPMRVAYDQAPPFGGAHDGAWAACNGVVYPTAVRTESMVHTLEHGAVWIAYDPDRVKGDELAALGKKVKGLPYTVMSPYPGLDKPVSLQSWGHRLKLADPADVRVDQFIKSLRSNDYMYPEPGATCEPSPYFDQDNPPPFDPAPPPAGSQPVGS
jgi:hypothetical protein